MAGGPGSTDSLYSVLSGTSADEGKKAAGGRRLLWVVVLAGLLDGNGVTVRRRRLVVRGWASAAGF